MLVGTMKLVSKSSFPYVNVLSLGAANLIQIRSLVRSEISIVAFFSDY